MKKNLAYISVLSSDKNKNYRIYRFREEARYLGVNLIEIHPTKTKIIATPEGIKLYNEFGKIIPDCQAVIREIVNNKSALAIQKALIANGANCLSSINKKIGREKLSDYLLFAKNKLPFPKTFILLDRDNVNLCLDFFEHKFPLVIKFSKTTSGIGTILIESEISFNSIIDYLLENKSSEYSEPALIQEYIRESKGRDVRVVVLNNEVIAAVERNNSQNDFRSNISQGGKARNINLTSQQEGIAIKAVKVLGLKFGGVDLLFGKKGPLITEVNSPCNIGFVEKKTGINITRKIIQSLFK